MLVENTSNNAIIILIDMLKVLRVTFRWIIGDNELERKTVRPDCGFKVWEPRKQWSKAKWMLAYEFDNGDFVGLLIGFR